MGWFYRRMVVPRVLANCEKIITVSQFERERILDVLHLPKEQLVAVYNGFNSHFHVQPKAPEIRESISLLSNIEKNTGYNVNITPILLEIKPFRKPMQVQTSTTAIKLL